MKIKPLKIFESRTSIKSHILLFDRCQTNLPVACWPGYTWRTGMPGTGSVETHRRCIFHPLCKRTPNSCAEKEIRTTTLIDYVSRVHCRRCPLQVVPSDASLEEPPAAVAGGDAIVFARRPVTAHLAEGALARRQLQRRLDHG